MFLPAVRTLGSASISPPQLGFTFPQFVVSVYVHVGMLAGPCVHAYTYIWKPVVNIFPQTLSTLFFVAAPPPPLNPRTQTSLIPLGYLVIESQGSSGLCLPSAGIPSIGHT